MIKSPFFHALFLFYLLFSANVKGQSGSLDSVQEALKDYRYAQALKALEAIAPSAKAGYTYYMLAAEVYQVNAMVPEARLAYAEASKVAPERLAPLIDGAKLAMKHQQYSEANSLLHQAKALDSSNAYVCRLLGELALRQNQDLVAIANFQQAIDLQENDWESRLKLSRLFLEKRAYGQADELCASTIKLDSSQNQIWLIACLSAFRQKEYKQTLSLAKAGFRWGLDSSAALLQILGISAFYEGDLDRAHLLLVRSLLAGEESEKLFFYLGQVAWEQEDYPRAEQYYAKAVSASRSEALGVYELHLALSLEEQARYREAIPHQLEAYELTGSALILYYLARDYDEAYADKTKALAYYLKFIEAVDSEYYEYREYAADRISEIRAMQHFKAQD